MFILNQSEERNFGTRLERVLRNAKRWDVLVGFFYFSGIDAVENALRENKELRVRILVGMDAEVLTGRIVEIYRGSAGKSDAELRERFLADLSRVMGTGTTDTEEFERRSRLFCEMLLERRLEIRKTREENHAKLYLMEMTDADSREYTWFTGSSNLSAQGLADRAEVNVEMGSFSYEDAQKYFDDLWDDAVELAPREEDVRRVVEIVKRGAMEASPYEAYLRLVRLFLDTRERYETIRNIKELIEEPKAFDGKTPRYTAFHYQTDAIRQADTILRRYGGVIIADVVGLGKSVVGSVLARAVADNERGIVIAPPGLVPAWEDYLEQFALARRGWKALSRGDLEKIEKKVHEADGTKNEYAMLIIDEAHFFRSERTQAYETLWQICRNSRSGATRKIVLMTATPFSNRPADVFALLKLFVQMRGNAVFGDLDSISRRAQRMYADVDYCRKNLKYFLAEKPPRDVPAGEWKRNRDAVANRLKRMEITGPFPKKNPEGAIRKRLRECLANTAKEIREIVSNVMIRRNRLDLEENPDYREEVRGRIAAVEAPREQFYELSAEQSAFYDDVIGKYFGADSQFTGAAYRPIDYTKEGRKIGKEDDDFETASAGGGDWQRRMLQQRNMAKFVRRLLVRRFESSFGAFRKTLENLIGGYENVKKTAKERGVVAVSAAAGRELRKMFEEAADNSELPLGEEFDEKSEELRERGEIYNLDKDFDGKGRKDFFRDLEADTALLRKILSEIDALDLCGNDPKAARLAEAVGKVLNGELDGTNRGNAKRKVLVFSEFSDTVRIIAEALEKAFPQRVLEVKTLSGEMRRKITANFDANAGVEDADDFDILVATDKISEGFNLNRAGVVINYDIPWNPVRVIQRVGRINRIGHRVFEHLFIFNFFPTARGNDITKQREIAMGKMFMIHTSIGEDAKIFSEDEEPTPAQMYERLTHNPEENEEPSFYTRMLGVWGAAEKNSPEIVARVRNLPMHVKTAWQKAQGADAGLYLFASQREAGEDVPAVLSALHVPAETCAENGAFGVRRMLFERAIERVACGPDTLAEARSACFWRGYGKMREALCSSPMPLQDGSNSIVARARVRLNAERQNGNCGAEDSFAAEILSDIQMRRTLPERTLSAITGVGNGPGEFEKFLAELHRKIGSLAFGAREMSAPECIIAEELLPRQQ